MKKSGENTHDEFVLYRKYRPQRFKDVVGQDHVVNVLENSIKLGTIAHAYLFAGSRGTGKTSIARIFAREIGTSEHDLYEMDAASNRGIDDIRELREGVQTVPFESKYKVYIIDEVHMLTKEAFNALLKTLEEPPAHAIFILATTEIDKLPETIVSRCQTFTFKTPHQAVLREFALDVAKKEGFTLEPAAGDLVAMLGDGSFRDTHGILQKVIAASAAAGGAGAKKVSLEEVEKVTGAPRASLLMDCLDAIAASDVAKALGTVRTAAEQNIDMNIFAKLLLERVRFILLMRFSPDIEPAVKERLLPDHAEHIKKLAGPTGAKIDSSVLLKLINAFELSGKAFIPELPLELAMMEIVGEKK